MNNITDDTPIAMLTVGQLKEILSIDKIMGHLTPSRAPDKEVLTAADVARLTGYSISVRPYKLLSKYPTGKGLGKCSLKNLSSPDLSERETGRGV